MWQPRLPKNPEAVYKAIADALQRDVAAGVIAEGERLPTHRQLAERLGVTTLTVTRGYAEAARRGLVESTVGRGTFVRGGTPGSADRFPVDLSRNAITGNEELELDRGIRADLMRLLRASRYETPAGATRHRHAAAAWLRRAGVETDADRVSLTVGAHQAILVLLHALCGDGDSVMAETLTYPGLRNITSLLRLGIHPLPLDGEGLSPRAFEQACRRTGSKVLYTLPNFQNPTGTVMPAERRREIAAIARKHGVTVIEDDVYGLFLPDGTPPIAAGYPEGTCYVSGASKTVAPALRLGFISAPASLLPRIEQSIGATTIFASSVSAEVFTSIVESGEADRLVTRKRSIIRTNQKMLRSMFGDRVSATHPASPHAWMTLAEPLRAAAVTAQADARGVTVAPASAFAVSDDVPNALRISLAAEDSLTLEPALRTLASVVAGSATSGSPLV